MEQTAEIVEAISGALHSRVEPVFLPLSIRNSRIEDVYLSFLRWLAPKNGCTVAPDEGYVQSPAGVADLILKGATEKPLKFVLPRDSRKRELMRRWIQAEIVVEPGQTNRGVGSEVSVKPLHLAVAQCFSPPGQPPNYGRLLGELLSRTGEDSFDYTLLSDLTQFFGSAGSDQVARLLQDALGSANVDEPSFPTFSSRWVWSAGASLGFQRKVRSLLEYRDVVNRRLMLEWLYAIFTFHLTTYFLRMALIAEDYARNLEAVALGGGSDWSAGALDDPRYLPKIPYGRNDESHARVLKQFPSYTSQIEVARAFLSAMTGRAAEAFSLAEIVDGLAEAREEGTLQRCFSFAMKAYPVRGSGSSAFKLSDEEKRQITALALQAGESEFAIVTRYLNFEDMSRRSNNVMEWQFYSTLAKNREFGFAKQGRGDLLHYHMSDGLILALLHCHCVEHLEPTLSSFSTNLEELGLVLDGDGRQLLEEDLVRLGLMESLADASDAKQLIPLYSVGGSRR